MKDDEQSSIDASKFESVFDSMKGLLQRLTDIVVMSNGRVPCLKPKKVTITDTDYSNLLKVARIGEAEPNSNMPLINVNTVPKPAMLDNYTAKSINLVQQEIPNPQVNRKKKKKDKTVVKEDPEVAAKQEKLDLFYMKDLNQSIDFSKKLNFVKVNTELHTEEDTDANIAEKENHFREEKIRQEEIRQLEHKRRIERLKNENAQNELKKHINKHNFTFGYDGNPIILKEVKEDKLNYNNFISVKHSGKAIEERKLPEYCGNITRQTGEA